MSADADSEKNAGPWNPGVLSQMPKELRPLATIFRPENVFTSVAAADELQGLTGFGLNELVVFRPQRLALHELLIRVTADFAVPDGSQIGDLGINFRRIASRILTRYVEPEMAHHHPSLRSGAPPADGCRRGRAGRRGAGACGDGCAAAGARNSGAGSLSLVKPRRAAAAAPLVDREWGPAQIAECERRARAATDEPTRLAQRSLARVLAALFAAHGHAWGTRELIVSLARDIACNSYGSDAVGEAIAPAIAAGRTRGGLWPAAESDPADRHQYQGAIRLRQEHAAPAAEETRRRDRGALERLCA